MARQARLVRGAMMLAQAEMAEGLRALSSKAEARIAAMTARLTHTRSCVRRIAVALADAREEVIEVASNATPSRTLPR